MMNEEVRALGLLLRKAILRDAQETGGDDKTFQAAAAIVEDATQNADHFGLYRCVRITLQSFDPLPPASPHLNRDDVTQILEQLMDASDAAARADVVAANDSGRRLSSDEADAKADAKERALAVVLDELAGKQITAF